MTENPHSTGRDSTRCSECEQDPIGELQRMFVDMVQKGRIDKGQDPALRPVFLKPHGVAFGHFEVVDGLDDALRVGVFGMESRSAWVRFSSDTLPTLPDLKSTLGIGIKLFGVPGEKLLDDGDTQDFILQNHDVFFVDTVQDMCEFTYAGVVDRDYDSYLDSHETTKRILKKMQKDEVSVLTTTYWSVLPYALGPQQFVKYKLEPETEPDGLPGDGPDYLATDMARRLREGEARFRFMVQLCTDPATMPLNEATVRWSEEASRPIHVATLILPRQDIEQRGQAEYGENLAFNAWHSLADHEPQGSLSEARKSVYAASAAQRRDANGVPTREPGAPKPHAGPDDRPDTCIVRAAIHPAIGVARVGNAIGEEDYVIGPEVPNPLPLPPGSYRDDQGCLKRQAACFRVYGMNAAGEIVAELTPDNAEIKWKVHLANQKAAWYEFQLALDIPEADDAPPTLLRNAGVANRDELFIDPGHRKISGKGSGGGEKHKFDTGTFMGREVYLGELRTTAEGRLIVLGGYGESASHDGGSAVTFANNEGWYDDVSDGPVTATVCYDDVKLKVEPAWVVVAPPDYGPGQKSVRTMWDLIRDVACDAGFIQAPQRPSFTLEILPILRRLSGLQWVNKGFAAAFGWGGKFDLSAPAWVARLSRSDPNDMELRRTLANQFRVFDRDGQSPVPWPWVYGDAMNIPPAHTPRQHAVLSKIQMRMLDMWAEGDFEADYDLAWEPPRSLEDVAVSQQGETLDKAALEFCLADAFHPGCEMTWPMRHASMYSGAFRIAHAKKHWVEPSFGAALDQTALSLPRGPLGAQFPGGLTRWMAIPWQTDTASCRSGYDKSYDPYVPTFWPATVPNQVLTHHDYEIVMDENRPMGERLAAFARRASWLRPLGKESYTHQINNMVKRYGEMGVVEMHDGPADGPFPGVIGVEDEGHRHHRFRLTSSAGGRDAQELEEEDNLHAADDVELAGIAKASRFRRAPFGGR